MNKIFRLIITENYCTILYEITVVAFIRTRKNLIGEHSEIVYPCTNIGPIGHSFYILLRREKKIANYFLLAIQFMLGRLTDYQKLKNKCS